MNPSELRHRIEIWSNVKTKNELGETDYVPQLFKTVWASIIPQTGKMQNAQVDTILTKTTHKIIIRYTKNITTDMTIRYKDHTFNISYILNPYFRNETLELFVEEVIE